jgi:hypothetical protein
MIVSLHGHAIKFLGKRAAQERIVSELLFKRIVGCLRLLVVGCLFVFILVYLRK